LTKLDSKRKKRKHIETIEDYKIDYLIRKNLVTCTCYYRHRINALKKRYLKKETFFGEIVDYYFVTKFQNKGSEYEQGLLWVKNAAIYRFNSNSDIQNFVENYLTCSTNHLDLELAKVHEHHHTRICKKRKNLHCRYNFSMPPMRRKEVLEPIVLVDETLNEKEKFIYNILEKKQYNRNNTFDEFLDALHLIEIDYILAIQSTLKQPMNLLQRKPSHTWNNNFSKNMPKLWNANSDAQFVLNGYAIASYCTS